MVRQWCGIEILYFSGCPLLVRQWCGIEILYVSGCPLLVHQWCGIEILYLSGCPLYSYCGSGSRYGRRSGSRYGWRSVPVRLEVGVPVPSGYQDPNPSPGSGSR